MKQRTERDYAPFQYTLKQEIKTIASRFGLDAVGITTAEPFDDLEPKLKAYYENGYDTGFEKGTIAEKIDPRVTMPWAESIIAVAMAYPTRLHDPPRSAEGAYRGFVARSAWGTDYHVVLSERLNDLANWLKKRFPDLQYEVMVDTGVLSDRAVAERAGIGWIGKNGLLITPQYGSFVYLGELIVSLILPPDQPLQEQCGSCTKCLDLCPTQAFEAPAVLNGKRCLSYHTQTKGFVPLYFREKMGNRLYGCDTCQLVCPYNRGQNWTHHEQFQPDPELVKPLLMPLIGMSKKTFQQTWAKSAAGWRGKKTIERNAMIALAHYRAQEAIPLLTERLHADPRPVMRGTAAWALGKIGGEKARAALEEAKQREKDEQVLEEIEYALFICNNPNDF